MVKCSWRLGLPTRTGLRISYGLPHWPHTNICKGRSASINLSVGYNYRSPSNTLSWHYACSLTLTNLTHPLSSFLCLPTIVDASGKAKALTALMTAPPSRHATRTPKTTIYPSHYLTSNKQSHSTSLESHWPMSSRKEELIFKP